MVLLGIEMPFEEFDRLMCEQSNGKELVVENGKVVAVEHKVTQQELAIMQIRTLKAQLQKYKEDVEQVELFDMERADYAEKKRMCAEIILQLRELEKQL